MQTLVINLEGRPDRFARFSATNGFLSGIERFAAVDGRAVDRMRLASVGLVDAELECTSGALGCALSHVLAWQRAVTEGIALTVLEDDAVVNGRFEVEALRLISELPEGWDIVYWGWNFDAPLIVDLLPGVSYGVLQCNQDTLRRRLAGFQALEVRPRPARILSACGTLAYTISPRGAGKLIGGCVPLKRIPDVRDARTGAPVYGVDLAMGTLFPQMNAYASVPPLVVSPNEDSSTILRTDAAPA